VKSLALLAVALVHTLGAAVAAEWQWSLPLGDSRAYLWIPPDCKKVRGVVVASHNMIEQGILEHPTMRKALSELGFAEVWVVPYLDLRFDFHKGAGERFEKIVDGLAKISGYSELSTAPVVPLGHSACASFPWNFAAWNPGRTLAILSIHGDAPQTPMTGYGGPKVDWGNRMIDGIPGLMVMGEYEWTEARRTPAHDYLAKHPGTPIAFLPDAGRGHFDYSDRLVEFLAMFLRKAAAARLPAGDSTALRPVDPKSGWLVEEWHFDEIPPAAQPAPHADYAGDRAKAFWAFDEEMAKAIEAAGDRVRGKKPQLLAVWSEDVPLHEKSGEPVTPRFLPGPDGITFELQTGFADKVPGSERNTNAARWARLPAGSPLGHADGPITLSRIVGPVVQVGPRTFQYRPGRAEHTGNRRNHDMWLLAEHPGDDVYKSAVQQVMVQAPRNAEGAPQTITFPVIADQRAGQSALDLGASSDSGLPISYYVLEGPAEVDGAKLTFTPIPPRAKFPVAVTVVATQAGRSSAPKIQAASPVARTFHITR
jgi:hypothetical protein